MFDICMNVMHHIHRPEFKQGRVRTIIFRVCITSLPDIAFWSIIHVINNALLEQIVSAPGLDRSTALHHLVARDGTVVPVGCPWWLLTLPIVCRRSPFPCSKQVKLSMIIGRLQRCTGTTRVERHKGMMYRSCPENDGR